MSRRHTDHSARFPEIIEDAMDAYRWIWTDLAKHLDGMISVSSVTLEGYSAGAHICGVLVSSLNIRT
jgi:acetyl esterase/lipase